MNKRKKYGKKSDGVKKIMVGGIIIMILAILTLVGLEIYNMPDKKVEREIERLAKEYYEENLYENFVKPMQDGAEVELSQYKDSPIEPVRLRRLISFSAEKGRDVSEIFSDPHYKCDTTASKVTYTPVSPFGQKDYEYKVELSCKEK